MMLKQFNFVPFTLFDCYNWFSTSCLKLHFNMAPISWCETHLNHYVPQDEVTVYCLERDPIYYFPFRG